LVVECCFECTHIYEPKAKKRNKLSPKLSNVLIDNDCHDPNLGHTTKARAWKGVGESATQESNSHSQECGRM